MPRLNPRPRPVNEAARRFVRKQAELAAYVSDVLRDRDETQRDFAARMGKKESAISRLLAATSPVPSDADMTTEEDVARVLTGVANPTLKTIVELEIALGVDLLVVPSSLPTAAEATSSSVSPTLDVDHVEAVTLAAFIRDFSFGQQSSAGRLPTKGVVVSSYQYESKPTAHA